jgi:alpha-L-rhamnosidase
MQPTRRGALGLIGLAGLVPSEAFAAARNNSSRASASVMADDLRVEWLTSPVGIDTRQPRFTWILRAKNRRSRNLRQTACRIVVGSSRQEVRHGLGDIWDSGKVQSSDFRLASPLELVLQPQKKYWWSVMTWDGARASSAWSAPASFTTGMFGAWRAQWIAAEPDRLPQPLPPNALQPSKSVAPNPLPVFRRDILLAKPVASAIVSICGLGHYELAVNGKAATRGVLNPGWTNYRKTVFYNTFDVTALLRHGRNALAVMLGNGMYNAEGYPGRYTKFVGSFGQPKLILQLTITHTDGSTSTIVSDDSWRTRSGPIVLSSAYAEDFDARVLPADWMIAPLDGAWGKVMIVQGPGGTLRAQNIPPVTEAERIKPVAITEPKPGVFVYDFGQNMSGWPKIVVRGRAGASVKLTPAELLAEDGLVDPASSGGRADLEHYYRYFLSGRGKETWHPQFSYYGFRYIQVEGAVPPNAAKPDAPVLLKMEAAFLHTDLRPTGLFETTTTLFNRVHRLIKYALLSNTFSVLTDCPHREKLGWLEQTYLNADTVFCNEDAVTLYEKMIGDIAEAQTENGMIPGIAPEYVSFINADGTNAIWRDSPEWGAAVVLAPLAAYQYYGDRRVLETGYAAMKRYAVYLKSKVKDGLIGFGMGDWYDLGPAAPGPAQLTSLTLASMSSYYAVLDGIAEVARLLGHEADRVEYANQAEALKCVFNDKLFDAKSGGYDSNSQTANAMPLALGLVPPERRQQVLDNLVRDIRVRNNHISVGEIGFHYLVLALMANGYASLLCDILSRTDAPSYAYQLAQGATSLTEAWNANRPNSQNHFMLGQAETWFYRGLAGINLDMRKNGPDRIRIAPQTVAAVSGCSAKYRSVVGDIVSFWRRKDGAIEFFVGIPAGVQATIVLPVAPGVYESGKPVAAAPGVLKVEDGSNGKIVTVGSGDYRFSVPEI